MLTATIPNVVPDARYNVKQTAEALGIHPNSVRKYTVSNYLHAELHKFNNRPFYTGKEIIRFWKSTI